MNVLALNSAVTMSSRDIADLLELRHDVVKRTIERLVNKKDSKGQPAPVIVQPPMVDEQEFDSVGRPRTTQVYKIEKRESYIIVAQLSPEFTARLVDRWQELEAVQVPTTLSGALRLAADQAEQIERQQAALDIAAPKVAFVDRYVESTGNKGFREVCKLLKANENRFREFLIDEKIMYRLAGTLTPMAQHLDAGRFEVKTGASDEGHAFNQSKFTPKGVNWIAGEWAKYQLGHTA